MIKKIKTITKEEYIEILQKLAAAVDKEERNFTEEGWEYIHKALLASAIKMKLRGNKDE